MVNNSLVKRAGGTIQEVSYNSNGTEIRLDAQTVKNYLVSGNRNAVTDQDIVLFMELCRAQKLNPFIKEAYLVKYGDEAATIVTGKDVLKKRAFRNPNYNGMESGIVVYNTETKQAEERNGLISLPGEQIIGGWARVFLKNTQIPVFTSVPFNERANRKKDGSLNSTWQKMPGTMIRKCAEADALRAAFPEENAALYSPEEIEEVEPVVVEAVPAEKPQDSLENMFDN